MGRRKTKRAPDCTGAPEARSASVGSLPSTVSVPPWRAAISADIERPSPVPWPAGLVVKNGFEDAGTKRLGDSGAVVLDDDLGARFAHGGLELRTVAGTRPCTACRALVSRLRKILVQLPPSLSPELGQHAMLFFVRRPLRDEDANRGAKAPHRGRRANRSAPGRSMHARNAERPHDDAHRAPRASLDDLGDPVRYFERRLQVDFVAQGF